MIQRDHAGDPTGLLVARPNATILYATLATVGHKGTDRRDWIIAHAQLSEARLLLEVQPTPKDVLASP